MQGRSPREIMSGSAGRSKTFRTSGGRAANRKPSSLQSILAARSVRNPDPDPPVGEGISLLPSPPGRRGGDEGLRPHFFFLFVLRERRVAFNDKISI
jgi:hypothetical protein